MKLTTRRLDEMTSREVERYLKAGGDLAFIPFGPVSGHGALLPLGIHCHWAHALSLMLAEKANGLGQVFRPFSEVAAEAQEIDQDPPSPTILRKPGRHATRPLAAGRPILYLRRLV